MGRGEEEVEGVVSGVTLPTSLLVADDCCCFQLILTFTSLLCCSRVTLSFFCFVSVVVVFFLQCSFGLMILTCMPPVSPIVSMVTGDVSGLCSNSTGGHSGQPAGSLVCDGTDVNSNSANNKLFVLLMKTKGELELLAHACRKFTLAHPLTFACS